MLATASVELRRYFYDFAVEVLELTQRGSHTAQAAVDEAWKRWGELIEQQSVLSRERQVGLLGELHLLRLLAAAYDWSFAIDAWHRTTRAEHDFCLELCDIEVKTTTSDRRVHTIGSIDQLLPSPNRPLYILSNQFAIAPKLAAKSFSLASTVRDLLKQLERDVSLQSALKQRLAQVGWRENHMGYYQTTFVVRDFARLVPVDDACPRIVPQMLIDSLGSVSNRIESVMYSIDVSDLGWQEGSPEYMQVLP
ncbi:MAG: PD-(D/E)XK motif protein [Actinobacteria bacterium]|nr:PD-(D/E)XK motif protein [Actinomycetota bacterium]